MVQVSCSWPSWTQWYASMQTQTNEGYVLHISPSVYRHIRTDAWPHTSYEVMLGQHLQTQVLLSVKHKACLCMSRINSARMAKTKSLSQKWAMDSKYTENIPYGINMNNFVEKGCRTYSHTYSIPGTTYCIYSAINPVKAHIIQNMRCSAVYLHDQKLHLVCIFKLHL